MTPQKDQSGDVKDFLPSNDDSTGRRRTASTARVDTKHSTRVSETQIETENESDDIAGRDGDADDGSNDETETVLLPTFWYGTTVYHTVNNHNDSDDPSPLCGTAGSYHEISLTQARDHADRRCRACAAQQNGVDHRPCPRCDELIPVTQWPQHVGRCDGTTETENESEADTRDADTSPKTKTDTDAPDQQVS
jgi:hypothetical protein